MVPSESEESVPSSVTRAFSFGDWSGPALAVGGMLITIVSSYVLETVFGLPAASDATPAATLTATVPSELPLTTSKV